MDIDILLGKMKKADERTEYAKAEEKRAKENAPSKSGKTNKQKYLRGLM